MALAFVVETGACVDDATSYATVLEASDYLSVKPNFEAWDDLDTAVKQNYLMWASRLLTQRARWQRGTQRTCDDTNTLAWPRMYAVDWEGDTIPDDVVPNQIIEATIEIAHHLFTSGLDPSVPAAGSAGAIKRLKADVVEIEYQDATKTGLSPYFPSGINAILDPLGKIPGLSGSNFVRIAKS